MARHGGPDGLTFELVPEDDGDLAVQPPLPALLDAAMTVAPSVLSRAARRAAAWLRSRTPLQLVAGAVTLATAIGAGTAAVVHADRTDAVRLATATGGVADLGLPAHTLWRTELETSASLARYPIRPVGVLGGRRGDVVVVAVPDFALSDPPSPIPDERRDPGYQLYGIDLDTGARRWTVPVGEAAACGSGSRALGRTRAAQPTIAPHLVCTWGRGTGSRVAVVAPDGTATRRTPVALDDTTRVWPGPGGTLWRTERPGVRPAGLRLVSNPDWGWRFSAAFDVPPVRLSAEDPVTGQRLWSTILPGGRLDVLDDWTRCTDTRRAQAVLDVGAVDADVSDDGAVLDVCGFTLVVAADGTVLVRHPSARRDLTSWPRVASLADGGLAVGNLREEDWWSGPWTRPADVYDRDGERVVHLDGGVLDPLASDGSAGTDRDTGVFVTLDDHRITAVNTTGRALWSRLDRPSVVGAVAHAGGVIVLARFGRTTPGELAAFDLGTGDRVWTAPLEGMGLGGGTEMFLRAAWTDGRVVVVVTPGTRVLTASPAWTAYDLRTGAQVWRLDGEAVARLASPDAECLAAAGRLLCVDGATLTRVS